MTHLDFVVYAGAAVGAAEVVCMAGVVWGFVDRKPHIGIISAVALIVIIQVAHASGIFEGITFPAAKASKQSPRS